MTFGAAEEKKELPGANHCLDDESKNFEDGVVRMAQGDDNLRINASDENVKDESGQVSQAQVVMQVQEGQARGSGVCWKQFLNLRSIRVLLVENDDSTRHIVNALLRNCNYEVIDAANGSQAWRILEDLTIHIDLILTEVAMPSLSGIGLLCKIMSHKTRKNVPVIMMSSHDSMGLVIKCLSKGAVDFLGKPIRKNELKNLWQHVWRRCQSSSGSGSESGTQTQKSVKSSESNGKSDNDSESNAGENNMSTGLSVGDGSDGGSGTQSSWTKQAVEVDSSQAATPRVQVAECPGSTCAQVVHSNYEASYNKGVPLAATKECQKDEQLDDVAKMKDLMMAKPINIELRPENADEVPFKLGKKEGNLPENDSNASSKQIENVQANPIIECIPYKHKSVVTSISGPQLHSQESEVPREQASEVKKVNIFSNEQVMELSLKRLRGVNDAEEKYQDDRNILRRSELSAFSRYNTSSISFRAPNGVLGSCSSLNNSPGVVRKESMSGILSHSNGPSSNDDIDKGSYTNKFSQNLVLTKDKLEATLMINGLHSSSAFIPVKNKVRHASHQVLGIKDDDVATSALLVSTGDLQQKLSVQQSHQHHHNFHYMEQPPSSNCNYSSLNKLAADTPQCGSNMLDGSTDGNPVNCTLNRSASGCNHGSNGKNGSSTPVNAVGETIQSEVGLTRKSGSGDASGIGHGNRADQNKHARRAAALTKFLQKRTELCFQKKIRYQNRKRVAEQRPRVRGQFVRKTGNENSTDAVDD